MHPSIDNTKRRDAAFTIIELMVAVSIIALMVVLSLPVLSVLQKDTRESAGYNTVAVAVSAARQLATTQPSNFDPLTGGAAWSGTAAVFTPSGEIRLVGHDTTSTYTWQNRTGTNVNAIAFADVAGREYINLPQRIGVVGITRNGVGGDGYAELNLITPPFAIRFNENGSLVVGSLTSDDGAFNVYYDGNGDGTINANSERPATYNPKASSSTVFANGNFTLPFDEIQTVIGVIVFPDQGLDLTAAGGFVTGASKDKIVAEGRVVFFSRYTGSPLRTGFQ